jgi:hypothetical protein
LETRKQLALDTLREVQAAGDNSSIALQSHKGGKKTMVTLGQPSHQPAQSVLTMDDAKAMMMNRNLNGRQLKGILADTRTLFGKGAVQPYLEEAMLEDKKELGKFFTVEMVNFFDKEYDLDPQPMAFTKDLEGLIEYVAAARGLPPKEVLKLVGLDRGQGHTQLILQAYKEDDLKKGEKKKKRHRRDEGVAGKDKAALGVNNVIVLAATPLKNAEDYINIDVMLEKVNLKAICFKLCGDMKVYNEISGIQAGKATFPCYGCEARRDPKTGLWEGVPAPLRTYRRNLRHNVGWLAGGGGVEGGAKGMLLAKKHFNCVNKPLIGKDQPDTPLILIQVQPGLHIKLGVVNDALRLLLDEFPPLEPWLRTKGIVYVPYHGMMLAQWYRQCRLNCSLKPILLLTGPMDEK